jgi:hypothetical protein
VTIFAELNDRWRQATFKQGTGLREKVGRTTLFVNTNLNKGYKLKDKKPGFETKNFAALIFGN